VKILVVDDNNAIRSGLCELLERDNPDYKCESASDGSEALLKAKASKPDLVILDLSMPGMSGLNLLRKLHEQGIMTPVILITALPDKQLDDDAIAAGALCLLRKPLEINSLLDCVERSLL